MAGTEKTDGMRGRIAVSKAGRDKGIRYAVIGTNDDGTLMLCDGKVHKAAKPKRKKPKHLQFEAGRIDGRYTFRKGRNGRCGFTPRTENRRGSP